MASKLYTVFVYGTLKQGEPNHHWFKKSNGHYKFLGKGETVEKYPLIIATKYNIPFLLYKPGVGHNVQGELYEIDDKVLVDLDQLEDHPTFYVREEYQIRNLKTQEIVTSWIYFIKNFKPELLEKNLFKSYSNNNEFGLKYVVRYERDPNYVHQNDLLQKE